MDTFISNSSGGAILVLASVAMVMLYLHPDPSPTTYIYDETVSLVGVAGGVVIGQAVGPTNVMIAILERSKIGKGLLQLHAIDPTVQYSPCVKLCLVDRVCVCVFSLYRVPGMSVLDTYI